MTSKCLQWSCRFDKKNGLQHVHFSHWSTPDDGNCERSSLKNGNNGKDRCSRKQERSPSGFKISEAIRSGHRPHRSERKSRNLARTMICLRISRRLLSSLSTNGLMENLSQKLVSFKGVDGNLINVNAFYDDSLPSGSNVGTVVAFHGAFGSHYDFKQIRTCLDEKNIRLIGINYPGFGITPPYDGQKFDNQERQDFTNKLIDELNISGKIVYLGHSRGAENALITTIERNDSCGLVLLNSVGIRESKTQMFLKNISWLYHILPENLADYFFYKGFTMYGYKNLKDGKTAITSVDTVLTTASLNKLPYIEKFNESQVKALILYSGKDNIIEEEITEDLLKYYKQLDNYRFVDQIDAASEKKIMDSIRNKKGASLYVAEDSHYQNRNRGDIIAKAIVTMLDCSPT